MASLIEHQRSSYDRRFWHCSRVFYSPLEGRAPSYGCWTGALYVMDDFGNLVVTKFDPFYPPKQKEK